MKLTCICGGESLIHFSYREAVRGQDSGLAHIFTCGKCGEQLRVYQTCAAYRQERDKLPALLEAWDALANVTEPGTGSKAWAAMVQAREAFR
jgi:transcription initiation factor IIE alpha subunit